MKLSLCNEVLREMTFGEQCDFAARLGYEGLEIAPFTIADDPRDLGPGDIAELRRAMSDAGVVCSSLHWLLVVPDGLSITSEDSDVHALTVEIMRRLTNLAAELGAGVLVHGSPKQRHLAPGREAEGRARAIDAFRAVAETAEAAGVVYCPEPLSDAETNFLNSVEETSEIVSEIGSPALRTMVDCAATLAMGGDPADVLDRHLPTGLVAHVQVNDGNRRGPGEGAARFGPVLSTLRRHDYSGWVAVEPFVYIPDGPACAARSIGYLQGILEGLE